MFILICYLYFGLKTFILICICILFVIVVLIFSSGNKTRKSKKPGTISHDKWYFTRKRCYSSKVDKPNLIRVDRGSSVNRNLTVSSETVKKVKVSGECSSKLSFSCQTEMSFLRSTSSSSVGLFDCSPVRRPLRSINERSDDSSPLRPSFPENKRTPQRDSVHVGNSGNDTFERSPSEGMSVGEFPLISLVSSLSEAVSTKTPKLKPSPVPIRIQPIIPQ